MLDACAGLVGDLGRQAAAVTAAGLAHASVSNLAEIAKGVISRLPSQRDDFKVSSR